MYSETTIKDKQYPTIAEAVTLTKNFNKIADAERDVRGFMAVLVRMATVSPRIAGHILTRNTALYAYEWEISSPDPKWDEHIKNLKLRLSNIIDILLSNHAQTSLFGAMALKLKWEMSDLFKAQVPKIEINHLPDELDILADGTLAVLDADNKKTVLDPNKTDYFFDMLQPQQRGGAMRSIMFHELLRDETMKEWANLNKRMKGIATGTIDGGAVKRSGNALGLSDTQISTLVSSLDTALAGIGDNNYLKTLQGVDVKLSSLVEAAAGASFSEFKKTLDSDIAIALLGQANTSELPANGGSRAAVQILNLIRTDILFADMLAAQRRINRFLLLDYKVNIDPNAAECPYKFDFIDQESPDYEANARKYEILARIGVTVSKEAFYKDLGIVPPADDKEDDTLELKQSSGFSV